MGTLKDRVNKEKTSTESVILEMTGKAAKKDKYPVNVVFDGEMEEAIKARAKKLGIGVATYIKMLVNRDLEEK